MANHNENRELAIKLTDVKKMYKLGQIGGGTLQADLQSWWAKKRGLEDPNTKIGEQRLIGQTFMALNGIDLEVYKGEALGIIGGNGAGKSTMLKLLSRVTAPTSGKIQIWGRIASMLEVGTGFNGEMTGRENIYMNGAILGMTKAEIDAKMEDIIEFSEVREFIDTPVKRYSSGMYVKLAFSVAAHLDSEIMIMDEVLAVGDMAFQKKCLDKMRDAAKKEGRTVLYVSHNMNTIRQLCDRCIVLEGGKVKFNGDVGKAIELYLGLDVNKQTHYVFDKTTRISSKSHGKLELKELVLINCQSNVFRTGQLIEFEIKGKANINLSRVHYRFEIKSPDGNVVGTMLSKENSDYFQGDFNEHIILRTDYLTDGKYRVDIVAYILNQFGDEEFLDGTYPGFVFELVEDANLGIKWLGQYWGHVRLPDARIVEKKERTDA